MQSVAAEVRTKKGARHQGPRHPFDRRTTAAKRYRELVHQFSNEAGEELTETRRAIVEQLVAVVMASEALTAALVRGETVDHEQQVRLANTRSRLMRELGIGKAKPQQQRTLRDHLEARSA